MAFKLDFYKSDVVGGESSPNSVTPATNRVLRTPREEESGYALLLVVLNGTSLGVVIWFKDPTSNVWIPLSGTLVVTANVPQYVPVPPDADVFLQLTTNTGSVTQFGAGFMGLGAAGGMSVGSSGVSSSSAGWASVLSMLQYNASPASLLNGQYVNAQGDSLGNQLVTLGSSLNDYSDTVASRPKNAVHFQTTTLSAGEGTKVISAVGNAQLLRVYGRNKNAAIRYLQVHNLAAAPSGGAIPMVSKLVAATSSLEIVFPYGKPGTTGITLAFSTTEDTYTAATAAEHWFEGEYYPPV